MLKSVDLSPRIGTEVKVDRKTLLDGSAAGEIRRLLVDRGVLVFRELHLTDAEQMTLTHTLGKLDTGQGDAGATAITLDKNDPAAARQPAYVAEYLHGTFYWHIDGATTDTPGLASVLSARRLSRTGGQTQWANTYAAYETLPASEQKDLDKVKVVHTLEASQRVVRPEPSYEEIKAWHKFAPKTHPLVWSHGSGRKSFLLGSTAFEAEDMNWQESSELLCRLRDWATQPDFVYTHEWTVGDLVIWDNTGTMHRVIPYATDSGRLMHRTALLGEEKVA